MLKKKMISLFVTMLLLVGVTSVAWASTPIASTIFHTVWLTSDNEATRDWYYVNGATRILAMKGHYVFYKGNAFRPDSMNADIHGSFQQQYLSLVVKIRTKDGHVEKKG